MTMRIKTYLFVATFAAVCAVGFDTVHSYDNVCPDIPQSHDHIGFVTTLNNQGILEDSQISAELRSFPDTTPNLSTRYDVACLCRTQENFLNAESLSLTEVLNGFNSCMRSLGVEVTPTALDVSEGGTAAYTVTLTSSPGEGVAMVTVESGGPDAVTVSPTSLTFNADNWNVAQPVTVSAVDDDVADGGKMVVLTHGVAGYGDMTEADAVTVTIEDDDTARVEVTPTALDVSEGGTATYTVLLTSSPGEGVAMVTVESDDPDAVTVSPTSLTFNADNWNTPQAVTVTAEPDDVVDGGKTVELTHQVSGYGEVAAPNIEVTVSDDDMAGIEVTPTALDVREGEARTYRVKLTSSPAGTVTVEVTSGNPGAVTVSPAELTFDAQTWNEWQEFTVTAVQDNAVDGGKTVVLTHRVSGYGNVTEADHVTVSVTDTTPPPIDSQLLCSEHYDTRWWNSLEAGERQSYQEAQQPYMQGIRKRYEDDQIFDCICDFHVDYYNRASADEQSIEERNAFFQGDQDLHRESDTCIEAQFTLTVDTAAINEDEGRARVTVSTGGVSFLTDQTITLSIGGTATEGTDYAIAEQTLTLPAGQTSVSTTVTARNDTVTEDDETIVITAQHGGEIIGEPRTITVMDTEPEALPHEKEVVEETLEAVVSSALSNVTTNIGTRFSAARGGTSVTVAGLPVAMEDSVSALAAFNDRSDPALHDGYGDDLRGQHLTLDRLLQTSAFQVSLAAADAEAQGAGPGPSLTVWGRVDSMFFDKESDDSNRYDGDLKAGYLGVDTWLDDRWLLGVAASITKVDADYGLETGGGKLDLSIVGVHPYVRLALDDVSELWLILGLSRGKLQNLSTAAGSTPEDSDITMYMGAAGMRRELTSIGGIDIALLGDAGFGSLRGGRGSGLQVIDNLSADAWRARLGFSGSHTVQLEGLAAFTPFVEIVGRYDGGSDGNAGLEIAGGLQYANPVSGLGLEIRANVLPLYSEDDYREYGFSISASASPGIGGEGLAMAVATSLGPQTGSTAALWRENLLGPANASDNLAESLALNAEIGYGFPVVGSKGVLTPFGGFRLRNGGGQQMRTGVRFGQMVSARPWNLELSGEQRTSDVREPEYLVNLLGRVRF